MRSFRKWRRRRVLNRNPIPDMLWEGVVAALPVVRMLDGPSRERLRDLTALFIVEKRFETVQGLQLTPAMQVRLASQACLPILRLGLDWYAGWTSVIIYPGEFVHRREEFDEAGVVHAWDEARGGESWEYGPVVLSWADVAASGMLDGYNVVIHELAHKLDMLNGAPNGFPPLHRGMDIKAWTRYFAEAFEDMNTRLDAGMDTPLDPYAAEHPAEFFAVASEYFFEQPERVREIYPRVYDQLREFYRQDPRQYL